MDILLLILQVLFWTPFFERLSRRSDPGAKADMLRIREAFRQPGMVLHGAGAVLLWAGVVVALTAGQIERGVTTHGAAGAVILLAGTLLIAWSLAGLRSWRFLPRVDAEHELCTTGAYGLVRHPIYLALDLLGLGSALWVATVPVLLATAMLVIGGDLRARAEERVLLQSFGDRYRDYMKQVSRSIPGLY